MLIIVIKNINIIGKWSSVSGTEREKKLEDIITGTAYSPTLLISELLVNHSELRLGSRLYIFFHFLSSEFLMSFLLAQQLVIDHLESITF